MCEFTVFLNDDIICREVVYTKIEGKKVILKKILGVTKAIENEIIEVDVSSERLILKEDK